MFVQSHIQRHHHHQHHNNNNNNSSNNHQHNHSYNNNSNNHHHHNHNSQQHSHSQHNQKHHNASSSSSVTHSSSNNKRPANSLDNNNKVNPWTHNRSTTSIQSLRASNDKLSHGIGTDEAGRVQLAGKIVDSATLSSTKFDKNEHHRNEFNSLGESDEISSQNEVNLSILTTKAAASRCARDRSSNHNSSEFSIISNNKSDDKEIAYESNRNLCNSDNAGIGKISAINSDEQQHFLLRDRTRSLGSHKSLRVYDFMPRNTRLAQVESATSVVSSHSTNPKSGSTKGDIINSSSAIKDSISIARPYHHHHHHQHQISSTQLRLAQTVSLEGTSDTSCHDNHHHRYSRRILADGIAEPRRAFSDVSGVGNSFWKIFTGSQQLLGNIFVDSSCWLAGRFSSISSQQQLSAQQLPSATLFVNNQSSTTDNYHRRQSFGLVRSFCMSFITYQFETWRLLANDLTAREKQRLDVNGTIESSSSANSYVNPSHDPHDRFNPIRSMTCVAGGFAHQQSAALNGHHQHQHHHHNDHHHYNQQRQQQQQPIHQLRGRMFYSLDRPILERQREVVFDESDDDNGGIEEEDEPVIRIPTIFREPLPPHHQVLPSSYQQLNTSQTSATRASDFNNQQNLHHKHRHNHHNHNHNHNHKHNPSTHREMNQPDADYDSLNFNNHHHDHHYGSEHPQDVKFDYGFATHTKVPNMVTGQLQQQQQQHTSRTIRAKFYLGQHSLDFDHHPQVTSPSPHLNFACTNHKPALLEKREDEFFSHNFRHQTWNIDRHLGDGDVSPPSVDCHQEQQEQQRQVEGGEVEGGSRSNDGDQYDLKQENSNTINQLSLRQSSVESRKRRTLKKSLSPLSFDGARRRLGLRRKGEMNQLSSICVNRSEEVIPTEVRHLSRQTTFNSLYDSGTESELFWQVQSQLLPDPRANFIEGIGFGQIASRQALVSPNLGDIQLSLSSRRGMLEVEIIRARGLYAKAGSKLLPSPYVKVYLMKEKKCIAKCRTHQVNQTLDPLYQEPFVFRNEFKNCVLQVIVWGDYGKRDRKSMMGVVQIHLDDLDISNMVIGWYKLFNIPSMTNSLASSKILRRRLLHHSGSISESPLNKQTL